MKLELVPKLAQQQTLSPKLLLSMKVLPLTVTELELRIAQELAENPALELREEAPTGEQHRPYTDSYTTSLRLFEPFQENSSPVRHPTGHNDPLGDMPAPEGGIHAHLLEQLRLAEVAPEVRAVAEEIIGNMDWRGYLLFPHEEIIASLPHDLRPYFSEALQLVRDLDPAGVGATDLRECLLLQLRRAEQPNQVAERIVQDHFQLLVANKIPQLAQTLGVSMAELNEAMDRIRRLSTRPGAAYLSDEPGQTIRPDVMVEEGEHGWVVRVINDGLPRLQLSEECKKLLAEGGLDKERAAFLKKKLQSAQWLLQALDGRRRTLKDIAEALMEFQKEFLLHGPSHLVPLRMQTVADAVGVHVSTVSRAVKGKYIQTPWGIYPLRFFFGGGLPNAEGGTAAAHAVKEEIQQLIDSEDEHRPLSDGELTAKLQARGYRVSRRTVSKYRQSLNIAPAKLRKTY